MVRRGVIRGGERLRPTWAATTVQVRVGVVMISDGPFAEAQQQIGGYCLIECTDLDEALEVAAKIPSARQGRSRWGRYGRPNRQGGPALQREPTGDHKPCPAVDIQHRPFVERVTR